jgi:hypothetical protein
MPYHGNPGEGTQGKELSQRRITGSRSCATAEVVFIAEKGSLVAEERGKNSLGHGWHCYHHHLRRETSAKVGDGEVCVCVLVDCAVVDLLSAPWLLRGCRIRYRRWAAGARVMHGFWARQMPERAPLLFAWVHSDLLPTLRLQLAGIFEQY